MYYDNIVKIRFHEGDIGLFQSPRVFTLSSADRYHTVKDGQSLVDISTRYYGTPANWDIIAEVNSIINPFVLETGAVLFIPNSI